MRGAAGWVVLTMAPLFAQAPEAACSACHPAQSKAHAKTLMAQTLERAPEARSLRGANPLTTRLGSYEYKIAREGDTVRYSVSDGTQTVTERLLWAVGQGEAAQTYVFEHQGRLYESRVSYYTKINGLDVTIGAPAGAPANMKEALGREMGPRDVMACFNCHSAARGEGGSRGVEAGTAQWIEERVPGVQCVHCHTSAAKHAAARQRGDLKTARLADLGTITSEEISDLCGTCHRTWADIQLNGPRGVANVRFQPYRIAHSKCYDAADRRIACTACHDPHDRGKPVMQKTDAACASCHSAQAPAGKVRTCKVGRRDCASCHMPRYDLPGAHFQFTDHYIRIVRAHEPYPN